MDIHSKIKSGSELLTVSGYLVHVTFFFCSFLDEDLSKNHLESCLTRVFFQAYLYILLSLIILQDSFGEGRSMEKLMISRGLHTSLGQPLNLSYKPARVRTLFIVMIGTRQQLSVFYLILFFLSFLTCLTICKVFSRTLS